MRRLLATLAVAAAVAVALVLLVRAHRPPVLHVAGVPDSGSATLVVSSRDSAPSIDPEPPSTVAAASSAPRPIAEVTIPIAPSGPPKPEEWTTAERVALARPVQADACRLQVLREWLRVSCVDSTASVVLLAGNADGVDANVDAQGQATLTLPMRRNDRRVLQLNQQQFGGYGEGPGQTQGWTLSETWLADEVRPTLALSGP